jgi:hypothetical protein
MLNTYDSNFLNYFQPRGQLKQIPAILHLVAPTPNAAMESVLVCQNTRETPMLVVVLSVSSVLIAQETELVSGTNVLILVLALVVKEPHVM